jgi:hypothetical protein
MGESDILCDCPTKKLPESLLSAVVVCVAVFKLRAERQCWILNDLDIVQTGHSFSLTTNGSVMSAAIGSRRIFRPGSLPRGDSVFLKD